MQCRLNSFAYSTTSIEWTERFIQPAGTNLTAYVDGKVLKQIFLIIILSQVYGKRDI